MNSFENSFSLYQSTDPPPIQTTGYKIVLNDYNQMMNEDLTPLSSISLDQNETKQEESQLTKLNNLLQYIYNIFNSNNFTSNNITNNISLDETSKSPINVSSRKGYAKFLEDLKKYELITGDRMDATKKKALTYMACLESAFNSKAKNPVSSAVGYFLMIKSNRDDLGTTEQYLNDTNLQFKAASRLYDSNLKYIRPYWNKAKQLGLSDFLIMYGCWFNPKTLISYIQNGGKDNGFKDKQGTNLTKVLKRAARVK